MLSEEAKQVKKELEYFNQTKRRLKNLQAELTYWLQYGGILRSPSLEPHMDGGIIEPYAEKRVKKIEELKKLIGEAIDSALDAEDGFLKNIQRLDPLSQNLLMERYMTGKPLNRIIKDFNYSESQIFRYYNKAFEKISEFQKDDMK